MTESMTEAVHDLINPWAEAVKVGGRRGYQAVDHEPLLLMLRNAVRASTGRTASGRSDDAARSILNLQAFALWESINRETREATRRHTRDNPNPMLGYAIRHLAQSVDALWKVNQIKEHEYRALIRRANGWRDSVWELFDPPVEKELMAPCPTCEQSHVLNLEGEMQSALIATYRQSGQPSARCRHCGYTWVGEAQLVILGRMIGAELDTEALEEMGSL